MQQCQAEQVDSGPLRVGSRWRGVSKILGRRFEWTTDLVEFAPPDRTLSRAVEGKLRFTVTNTFQPEGGGTRFTYKVDAESVWAASSDELLTPSSRRHNDARLGQTWTLLPSCLRRLRLRPPAAGSRQHIEVSAQPGSDRSHGFRSACRGFAFSRGNYCPLDVRTAAKYCRGIRTLSRRPAPSSSPRSTVDYVTGGRCGSCTSLMTELTDLTADQAAALVPHWQLALRAEDKSPATIKVYIHGVRSYLSWCIPRSVAPMTRTSLNTWITEMLDAGAASGTARTRQLAVRRFTAWLIAVGRLPADPFLGIKGPKQHHPLVSPLTDDELRALLTTCIAPTHRPNEPLHHRRDEAIIRLMFETGIRAGELLALRPDDIDLVAGLVIVRRGKGGRGRAIPIGPAATRALGSYLALRQHHRHADSADLWLGERGARFGYDGLGRALRRRAQRAGIRGFHPHKLRRPPLARSRRLRIRAHGHRRMDPHRHARPLHPSARRRTRCPRSPPTQPRKPLMCRLRQARDCGGQRPRVKQGLSERHDDGDRPI